MLAQDWRVNTVRMKGSVSPCRCTMEAIWITGSLSASGKIPGKQQLITGGCQATHIKYCSWLVPLVSCKHHRKGHTFPSSTLNIKAKDSERCNLLPLSLCWVAYEIGPSNIHFILTEGHLKEKKGWLLHSNRRKFWKKKNTTTLLPLEGSWPTLPRFWESVTNVSFSSRTLYFPLGSSIQQHPTTSVSTMNLKMQQGCSN